MLKIEHNISLREYNTFGVNASALHFAEYDQVDDLKQLLVSKIFFDNRWLHIGQGSNLLFINDFNGLIIHSAIKGIEIVTENENSIELKVGSGVIWDDFVEYCVSANYYGVENLSLIPGEVGSAAVQNIGAYGSEVKNSIILVNTLDTKTNIERIFTNRECDYGYRDSIFKNRYKDRYIITHVTFRLSKLPKFNLQYNHLAESVKQNGEIGLENIRQTIINIRNSKLPNPKELGNAGSFFKNPIIKKRDFEHLQSVYNDMPHYDTENNLLVKIPAGWLIEQCGLKGKRFGNGGIHKNQALVIVNYGTDTKGKDIEAVADTVQKEVLGTFNITLEPEVNYIY